MPPPAFDPKNLTAVQLRAARAMLNWRAEDVAERAKVHVLTVRRAELSKDDIVINLESATRIVEVLQKAGIIFLASTDTDGAREGLMVDPKRFKPREVVGNRRKSGRTKK